MSGAPQVIGVVGAGTMGAGHRAARPPRRARGRCSSTRTPAALERGVERSRSSSGAGGRPLDAGAPARRPRGRSAVRRPRRVRADHRGRPRAPRDQARAVRAAVARSSRRRLRAGHEHLVDPDHRDRARRVPRPERVVGMHFFNPAPLMRLVEVIAGERVLRRGARASPAPPARRWASASSTPPTAPASWSTAATARSASRPCGCVDRAHRRRRDDRPHRAASAAASGWGRSSCMDLVGIDVGFEVSRSFYELSFGEPRWRPSPLMRPHGRRRPPRPQDRPRLVRLRATARTARTPRRRRRRAAATGGSSSSRRPADRRRAAPRSATRPAGRRARPRTPTARCRADPRLRRRPEDEPLQGGPRALLLADGSLARARRRRRRGRLPRAAAARAGAPRRADPRPATTADVAAERAEALLRTPAACTSRGSATRRGSCSDGSSASSSTRPLSRSARASAARGHRRRHGARAQPPARPARAGATYIGLDHVLAILDALRRRARRGALPHRAAAAAHGGR